MKIRFTSLILVVWCSAGWADFSDALFQLHPAQPMDGAPYLIEVTGEWPTDCVTGAFAEYYSIKIEGKLR